MRRASALLSVCGRLAILAAGLGVLLLGDMGRAAQKKSDAEVKVAAAADKPSDDGKQVVTVTLDINSGWHTYANPVGNDTMLPNQTLVTIKSGGKALEAKIAYPEGKLVKDKDLGDYRVYEDKVTIKATVQRVKGETGPLEVSVRISACDEKMCLLPATVKLNVP